MVRVFKLSRAGLWLLVLCGIVACSSEKREEETTRTPTAIAAAAARFDTLQYDDGVLNTRVREVRPGDTLGVWFTPPRTTPPCSLVAVQYFFGDSAGSPIDTVQGFVNRVARYPNGGAPLSQPGTTIVTFELMPRLIGQATTVSLTRPLAVNDSADFFIGWVSSRLDTATFPIGLRDDSTNYNPPRSYRFISPDSIRPLPSDLGVRAIFTANLTFELRWDKKNTDLDLYLITARDTVFWDKRQSPAGGRLDVDDNDGFGPEKIRLPFGAHLPDSAQLGVYYYGPATGKPTKASVLFYLNETQLRTIGPCTLKPRYWWNVAKVYLDSARIVVTDSCDTTYKPLLSRRRKRQVGQ